MATFSDRFKSLRLEAGLTQEELAKKLRLSKGAVGNYESGVRSPRRQEDLEAIADFFNVDIDYLLGRTNDRPEFSLEEQWLVSCYRNADADTKAAVKLMLRKFGKKDASVISAS